MKELKKRNKNFNLQILKSALARREQLTQMEKAFGAGGNN